MECKITGFRQGPHIAALAPEIDRDKGFIGLQCRLNFSNPRRLWVEQRGIVGKLLLDVGKKRLDGFLQFGDVAAQLLHCFGVLLIGRGGENARQQTALRAQAFARVLFRPDKLRQILVVDGCPRRCRLDVPLFNDTSLSSSVFLVITAWVTLLYVVGLALVQAATSVGRIGLGSLALGQVVRVRFGSTTAENTVTNSRLLYPRKQTLTL